MKDGVSLPDAIEVLTIARWGGLAEWRRFLTEEGPTTMHQMRELGAKVSIEVFEEVDDYTSWSKAMQRAMSRKHNQLSVNTGQENHNKEITFHFG